MGSNLVPSYDKSAPKHRAPKARKAPKAALKTSLTLSSMAVVATGLAVGTGQLAFGGSSSPSTSAAAADLTPAAAVPPASAEPSASSEASAATQSETPAQTESTPIGDAAKREVLSRSADRQSIATGAEAGTEAETTDPTKVDLLSLGSGNAMAKTEDMSGADPRSVARALLGQYGWSQDQFGCLDSLWTRESGWNPSADNPSSSAYGIPQALPGSKMASAGSDWATNPVTQIRWGLGYISERYGSPCSAWGHSQATGFY